MSSELSTFFNDLRAAVLAGVKLEIGNGESSRVRALNSKKLDRLEKDAADGHELPERCEAAIETWKKTGSMIPVLEGLSTRLEALNRISRLFRKSILYVLAIAILAIAALVWYQLHVLPEISAIRQDLIDLARPAENVSPLSVGLFANITLVLFALGLMTLLWWLTSGGVARAGWWLGADTYLRYRTLGTASRTLQALVAEGVEPDSAAELSGRLAGLGPEETGELLSSIQNLDRNSILSSEWSDYLLMMAQQQYVTARIWGPVSLIVFVGGAFTLMFVVLAYWPITSLVHELSHSTQL